MIMLSITDNRSAGFAMGATDYLVKPVDLDRLAAILSKYCPAPAPPGVLAQSMADEGEAMRPRIFRSEALERLSSPEQLDTLLQITSPRYWLGLTAIFCC